MWAILGIACVASGIYSARLLHSAGAIAFQGRPGGTSRIPKIPETNLPAYTKNYGKTRVKYLN